MKKCLSWALAVAILSSASTILRAAADKAEIYQAIRRGDKSTVEALVRAGVSPNDQDEAGNSLLLRAAMYGNPDLLAYLIAAGADVNLANKAGATPLMRAAGSSGNLKLLVEHGADVNARSALGNTPLLLAARAYGSAPAVKLLLEHGADPQATNNFGASAIQAAAASGDLETMRLLLKHGADVNAHSRGSDPSVLWGGGRSPLMWAAVRGDTAIIKLLLNAGASVNEPEGFGTPLIQAAWTDQLEASRLLLKAGAEVNARDLRSGYTALHWAASSERNNSALVDLLLKSGADANSEGGEQVDAFLGVAQTPLMLARKRGETAITRSLMAVQGKVNATGEKAVIRGARLLAQDLDAETLRAAVAKSMPLLQESALESKKTFLKHASKQNCASCHQQFLPLAATACARKGGARVNEPAENQLLAIVKQDSAGIEELTCEATFHPEPAHAYGYALFALAAEDQPADPQIDAMIHHLLVIQGKGGQWHNNMPRPPLQTSDVAPTALAIKALNNFGFPGRAKEIQGRIAQARDWLWKVRPANAEEQAYQILGLAWAGENAKSLRKLVNALVHEQRADGGWAQLSTLESDAYATGQVLFALHAGGLAVNAAEFRKGLE